MLGHRTVERHDVLAVAPHLLDRIQHRARIRVQRGPTGFRLRTCPVRRAARGAWRRSAAGTAPLRLESANSPFTADGRLTQDALDSSRLVIEGRKLGNQELQARFSQRGGVRQQSKYSTPTNQNP
jgi:hypothetical protein